MNNNFDWFARIGVAGSILLGFAQYGFNATGSWMHWLYLAFAGLMSFWAIMNSFGKTLATAMLEASLPLGLTVFCLVSQAHLLAS